MNIKNNFIRMIREIIQDTLKKEKISQRKLCLRLNINRSNFCQFLKGQKTISIQKIEKILTFLNIKLKPEKRPGIIK